MAITRNNFSNKELLKRAENIRTTSDDPHVGLGISQGVGCVIYKDGEILSEAANGFPSTIAPHNLQIEPYSPLRYDFIEHAERRAIFLALKANKSLESATLYCTRSPCSECARAIVEVGIANVFLSNKITDEKTNYMTGEKDWRNSQASALRILELSGVNVSYLDKE